jgi:hypothetical protein
MSKIIVEIDHPSNIERFTNLLKDLNYVKHFKSEKNDSANLRYLIDADWAISGRSATEDELINMVSESKQNYTSGKCLTTKQARERTQDRFEK